jgi:hypothetical protein
MNKTTRLLLFVCLAAGEGAALAQNNDITILGGGFFSHTTEVSTPGVRVSSGVTVAGELSYARRIYNPGAMALDFELPVIASGAVRVRVHHDSVDVSKALVAFTPGVRFSPVADSPVSPFVFAGFGPGWVDSVHVDGNDEWHVRLHHGATPIFSCGGGADVRFTRHFGFRAQLRDLIALGDAGRHHRNRLLWELGFSFRW